jgi:CHAD domain-containing protein
MSTVTAADRIVRGPSSSGPEARHLCVGEVVRLALGADVARLLANDAPTRIGEDPEGVHQARVATRRLRSHLATFAPVIRRAPSEELSGDLRWLGHRLGAVRDLDVLRDRFALEVKTFDPLEREDLFGVLDALDASRRTESAALFELLDSERYRALLGALGRLVAQPPLRKAASLPAAPFLAEAIYERFVALEAAVDALPAAPSDDELHAIRKVAKPLRYVTEVGARVLGAPYGRLARRVTELCDELGRLHDGAAAGEWLDAAVGDLGRSAPLVRLRAAEVVRTADARGAWPASWVRVLECAEAFAWPRTGVPAS